MNRLEDFKVGAFIKHPHFRNTKLAVITEIVIKDNTNYGAVFYKFRYKTVLNMTTFQVSKSNITKTAFCHAFPQEEGLFRFTKPPFSIQELKETFELLEIIHRTITNQ